jgi:hypothetical protein
MPPCRFITKEITPGNPCIGGSVDMRAGLNIMEKREISCPCRESNHIFSVLQPVAVSTELFWHLGNGISGVEFSASETTALFCNTLIMRAMNANSFK